MRPLALYPAVAAFFLLAVPAFPDVLPSGSQGQVTLDWRKFNDLWTTMKSMEKKIETLEKPETEPPIPFTITKAAYKATVGKEKVMVHALYGVDVFESKKWVTIPFLPATVALQEARLDGNPIGVVQNDGFHALVIKKPGHHILSVEFVLKSPKEEEAPLLQFAIPETPITMLSLEFPRPHLKAAIEPSQGIETTEADGGKHTLVTAAIPPSSQITVRWQKAMPEDDAEPSKLYLDTETLLTVSEGTLRARWTLNYTILHKGVRELIVGVPESWNVLSVTADGLQEWKLANGPNGPALAIQMAYVKKGTLQLQIVTEKAIGEKDGVLDIAPITAAGVEREQGVVGVEAKGSLELQVQESKGLNSIDPQELPASVWQSATQPILYAFRYTKPHQLALAVHRHPEVAVLTTTVDNANAVTLITPRGQMITRIRYEVRNHLKQYLELHLPAQAQLWSAFVDGQPVKPTQTDKGSYRIPLAKSQIDGQGQSGFPVEIVYYKPIPSFKPVGYRTAMFPVPDAPVSRMLWSLYLPERYRFLHFGGDMEKGELASAWNSVRGAAVIDEKFEAPQMPAPVSHGKAALKYGGLRAKDLEVLNESLTSPVAGQTSEDAAAVVHQASLEQEMFRKKEQQLAAGVFPVDFQVPASGQLFHFGQVMVVGQDPRVSMFFVHVYIVHLFGILLFGLLCAALYRNRERVMKAISRIQAKLSTIEIPRFLRRIKESNA